MKKEFVDTAVANLHENVQLHAKWKKHINHEIDGKLELNIGNKIIVLNAVVRNELKEESLNEIYKLAVKYVHFIVIVNEVPLKIKEFMRQVHLAHLDVHGNIFLEQKNIFILVEKSFSGGTREIKQNDIVEKSDQTLRPSSG